MTDHESWRKARAGYHSNRKFFPIHEQDAMYRSFIAGMEAEHEVAKLMGKLEVWRGWVPCTAEKEIKMAEAELKALLASGKVGK